MHEDKDSTNNQYKKVTYHLQEMAFQKYPFEINNKTFFCLQSYFQDELLNGVDLDIKQCKGINLNHKKITYLSNTQELVMAIGSNIVTYNTQKRVYNILTSIDGYAEIIKTYNCRINDKMFVYWLQSDEQGLNQKIIKKTQKTSNLNNHQPQQSQQQQPAKITSIWNLFSPGKLSLKKQTSTKVQNPNDSQKMIKKKITFQPTSQQKIQEKLQEKQQKNAKTKKTVRINAPQTKCQQKKRMRICIYDYQKKLLVHKQPIQIPTCQSVHDIIVYLTSEKIVGYIINQKEQQKSKIYYRRFKINDAFCTIRNGMTKRSIHNDKVFKTVVQKFKLLESLFMIEELKYNGETDQYNMKDDNTVYSLQFEQDQHEIQVNINHPSFGSYKKASSKQLKILQQQSSKKIQQERRRSIYSNSSNQSYATQRLTQQIQKVTHELISTQSLGPSQSKLKLKITQEIQLLTEQIIIDFSLNETYLALVTNQNLRFYSIFNLNTLLFKVPLIDIQDFPMPTSIQINKSFVLITHSKTTLVSSYSILERKLKYNSTCEVQIEHCSGIKRLFMNQYNCEVAILADQYQIQGRMTNLVKSRKIIQNSIAGYRKNYIDVSLAYINCSSTKCESKPLFLKGQSFSNLLTCQWNSQYLIETQNQIQGKQWRESFQNLKCSCLHPTGLYIVIGFNDCFKIYVVTFEGLQNTYMSDGVKDCQAIAYSSYGQHFAVGSSNSIGIYNSYSAKKLFVITLPVTSIVQSLQYKNNHLICVLKAKRIIVYHSLLGYKEIFSFNPRNYLKQNKMNAQSKDVMTNLLSLTIKKVINQQINSIFYDLDLSVIIFSSQKKVYMLNMLTNQLLGNYEFPNVTSMQYNKHLTTLFLGCETGQLVAFPWPNKPSNILNDLPTFKFHSSKITKIKITSDYKYLITLGDDKSMYKSNISYVLNLKRLKGQQLLQQKGHQSLTISSNFLTSKGYCQFTHYQDVQKIQSKKQLQEEVVNILFMLPQQRYKQKQHLFSNISDTKDTLHKHNIRQYQPLQKQSIELRNKIIDLKKKQKRLQQQYEKNYISEQEMFQNQSSKLLKICSQLNDQSRRVHLDTRQEVLKVKHQLQKQMKKFVKTQQEEYETKISQMQRAQQHKISTLNKFHQISLIQFEKQKFLQTYLTPFVSQISLISSMNSQISSKNGKLQKQILVLKRKIQDLKFVKMNAQNSVQKLKSKNNQQGEQKRLFQKLLFQNAKIDVSEMQKKYIKATKTLIQKNKEIDIKLTQYEKQKNILVALQKTVENTQGQIDNVVDSLRGQKQFMKEIIQKIQINHSKINKLIPLFSQKKIVRSNIKGQQNRLLKISVKLLASYQQSEAKNQNRKDYQLFNLFQSMKQKILDIQDQAEAITVKAHIKKPLQTTDEDESDKKIKGPFIQLLGLKKGRKKDETYNFNQTSHNNKKYISQTVRTLPNKLSKQKEQGNHNLTFRKSFRSGTGSNDKYKGHSSNQQIFGPHLNSLQKKKDYVIKRITTEDKLMNKIKTDQYLYTVSKNRLLNQNQDLLATYNSLSYDNKYFNNILKAYDNNLDQQDKQVIEHQLKPFSVKKQLSTSSNFLTTKKSLQNKTKQENSKQKFKQTPFQLYIKSKDEKIEKKLFPKSQEVSQNCNFFSQKKKQLKKRGKWAEARLNTLPCVEFQFQKA